MAKKNKKKEREYRRICEFDMIRLVADYLQAGYYEEVEELLGQVTDLAEAHGKEVHRVKPITLEEIQEMNERSREINRKMAEQIKQANKDVSIGEEDDFCDAESIQADLKLMAKLAKMTGCNEGLYQYEVCFDDNDEDYNDNDDCDGDCKNCEFCDDNDEDDDEEGEYKHSGTIKIDDAKNCVVVMPTVYGRAILVQDDQCFRGKVGKAFKKIMKGTNMPVFEVTITDGCVVFDPFEYINTGWYPIIPDLGDNSIKDMYCKISRMVFPIVDGDAEKSVGLYYKDAEDAVNIVSQLLKDKVVCDFVMPRFALKVTHPEMRCRNMQYEMDTFYTAEEPIALHKNGFHFATSPRAAFNWYKPFDKTNEIYIVQVEPDTIEDKRKGIGVSSSILFIGRTDWEFLLPRE